MKHPLPEGTVVKVAKKHKNFTIVKPLYQEDELAGYRCLDPQNRLVAVRIRDIKKEVNVGGTRRK